MAQPWLLDLPTYLKEIEPLGLLTGRSVGTRAGTLRETNDSVLICRLKCAPVVAKIPNMGDLWLDKDRLFAKRFRVDAPGRAGGMGTVFRAVDEETGALVALKVLHSRTSHTDEAERFLREAQILGELHHPGIVSYVTHGQTSLGERFLAMEWLEGHDLGERLSMGATTVEDGLRIIEQVTDALTLCHERGIVHRDIKPSNLFLVGGDIARVKLIDFGIARSIHPSRPITRSGVLMGTPSYIAPEHIRDTTVLTPAADMFAIGCILYECLSGQPPFVADHIEAVLARILFDEPTAIEERCPGVSPSIAALIRLLLQKQPEQRPQSAGALRDMLSSVRETDCAQGSSAKKNPPVHFGRFASQSQHLCSVVLAAAAEDPTEPLGTEPGTSIQLPSTDKRVLLQALAGLGVSAEFLAGRMLVAAVTAMTSAQDQAIVAAHAALLIKESWPQAIVSLATGRGTISGRTVIGEVIDLAARRWKASQVDLKADPVDGVLMDGLTAQLVDERFLQVSHRTGTMLLRPRQETDTNRLLLGKATPCVGRETELGILSAQLTSCIENTEARVVLFTAPPGAGKSRLRHEFLRVVETNQAAVTVLLGRGDVMSIGSPYGMLRNALLRLCGVSGSEPIEVQRERLKTRIAKNVPAPDKQRVTSFLSELCNLSAPDEGNALLQAARRDPKRMREFRRSAFLDFLTAECAASPVLLVLDDLHWGDAPTVSLLDESLCALSGAPLFLLAFARPEVHETFPSLWSHRKVQHMPLSGLSKRAAERLIVQLLGSQVPTDLVAQVIDRADGNALFLEELIRSIVAGRADLHSDTVLAMLQARLGRLDSDLCRVLRASAVFGATFWRGGVASVLGLSPTDARLDFWFDELSLRELIFPQKSARLPSQREFRFHHSLVRDAAYSLLTAEDLRLGHLRAAEFLEAAGERDFSILGEHHEQSGDYPRAAQSFANAAERAIADAGMESALHYVARGLRCEPQGETLGVLRSLECAGLFWMFEFERSFVVAMDAMSLLRPGSGAHCRALAIACQVAIHGSLSAQQKLPEFLSLLLTVEPDNDGVPYLIEGLGDLAATMCCTSPFPMLQVLIARLQALLARVISYDPAMERWLFFCRAVITHHHQPTPWFVLQESLRSIELSERAGDQRTLLKAEVLGKEMVMSELGDPALPSRLLETLRGPRLMDNDLVRVMGFILAGLFLSMQEDAAQQAEALRCAEDIRALGPEMTLTGGFSQLIEAQVALNQQQPQHAEAKVRAGLPQLVYVPLWMPLAQRLLIQSLLAQSRMTEAVQVAEQGLQLLAQFGGLGCLEVELRLAISEAFIGIGNLEKGKSELRAALHHVQLRANDIAIPQWRQSYLTRNPHCVRIQLLAKQWDIFHP